METESLTNQQLLVVLILTFAVASAMTALLMSPKKKKSAVSPDEFRGFRLIDKETVGRNTRRFTFCVPLEEGGVSVPVGQHILFRLIDEEGKSHQRSYTPVSVDTSAGKLSFIVKIYQPCAKFPLGGKMSQHLDALALGDCQDMKGPKGHLHYLGGGKFTVKEFRKPLQTRKAKRFGMIAGGTGITPMLQILKAVFDEGEDVEISLLYANQEEDDILVRDELEKYAASHPHQFRLHYTLDRPPHGWTYSKGFVTKDMIHQHLPRPTHDGTTQVLMCGPGPMIRHACIPSLKELGFKDTDYTAF